MNAKIVDSRIMVELLHDEAVDVYIKERKELTLVEAIILREELSNCIRESMKTGVNKCTS
jgi:hypothetical protein